MISLGPLNTPAYSRAGFKEQEGAELGQAQVKLDDIVVIVVEVVVTAMVEVEVQLLFRVGGCSVKTKLILISTLVEVELGNKHHSSMEVRKYRGMEV